MLVPATSASAADATFERVELPGFSVEVPAGRVVRRASDPSAGVYEVDLTYARRSLRLPPDEGGVARVTLSWLSRLDSDAEREIRIRDEAGLFGILHPEPPPAYAPARDRRVVLVGDERFPKAVGSVDCAADFGVTLVMTSDERHLVTLAAARRVLESVACHVTADNRAPPVPALRLPAGFRHTADNRVLRYDGANGDWLRIEVASGDPQLHVSSLLNAAASAVATVFNASVGTDGFSGFEGSRPIRGEMKHTTMRAHVDGEAGNIHVALLYCPQQDMTFISILRTGSGDAATAKAVFAGITCPAQ